MNILVTGGYGFIFSNFIRHMINKYPDYKIVNIDKLTYAANTTNLADIENNKNYKFYKGDICDKNLIEKILKEEKIHVVVNAAAETHVDRSISDVSNFLATNVLGTFTLLEAAKKAGIEKFIQISTDEVYGDTMQGSFKETDKLNPRNPYAASKASGDLLAMSYFTTHGLPVTITRSTNNYGPFHYPEKFIPKAIIYALTNKKIPVYGEGKEIRDWLFVQDNCEAVDLVMHKGKPGEIYNIAGKQELQNIEVVKSILSSMCKDESLIEFVKNRPAHDRRYSLDIEKIRQLGWQPRTNFNEGIAKTMDWFEKNRAWWMPAFSKQQLDFHKNF